MEIHPEQKKSAEVVLANLPWKNGENWGVRAGSRWPHLKNKGEESYLPFPFFLAYSAALFAQQGVKARLIDSLALEQEAEDFLRFVHELRPRLLIAEVSTPSLENDLRILSRVSRAQTRIAVCGLDFSIQQPEFLEKYGFIDYVMPGEYEYTARELYAHLGGEGCAEIPGLIYRDNGRVKINPARPLVEDLDQLPWPLREGLEMDKYIDAPGNLKTPGVQMLASRGCPFACTFCTWPQLIYRGRQYRLRAPEKIADEMEYLIKEKKFKSVYFDDDTFNINREHVLRLCQEIKNRGLRTPWAAMARADLMDEELLREMKAAGLYSIKYGVESARQDLLDQAGKGMDLQKTESMIRLTKSLGVKIHLSFAFGFPGETRESIDSTIDYAIGLEPDTAQFSILTPYPGTEHYRQMDTRGYIVSRDLSDYNGSSQCVVRTETLTAADIAQAREKALLAWKRYRRSKKTFILMPFDAELRLAFRNNLKRQGAWRTMIKAARYIAGPVLPKN